MIAFVITSMLSASLSEAPVILSEAKDLPFVIDAAIFIVAMYAIGFGWAWFAEQAKGLTGTVSCRCGKRTVTGIAPRAHPDFTKLLTANCPSCAAAVSAVPPAVDLSMSAQGRPNRFMDGGPSD